MPREKSKLKIKPKEVDRHKNYEDIEPQQEKASFIEKKEEKAPVILLAHPRTALRIKREKTENLLKKSCTSAYKPLVPNDIYKKNFSSKLSLSISYTCLDTE